jgi:uncharacterized membrane protein
MPRAITYVHCPAKGGASISYPLIKISVDIPVLFSIIKLEEKI